MEQTARPDFAGKYPGSARRKYTLEFRKRASSLWTIFERQGNVKYNGELIQTAASLARALHVPSVALLRYWSRKSWDGKAARKRLNKRGRKRQLSLDDEGAVQAKILARWRANRAMTNGDVQRWIEKHYQWRPHISYVSRLIKRNDLSSKKVLARRIYPTSGDVEAEARAFRDAINLETSKMQRSRKYRTRVWTMDCIKLPDNPHVPRGIGPKGRDVYRVLFSHFHSSMWLQSVFLSTFDSFILAYNCVFIRMFLIARFKTLLPSLPVMMA